MPKPTNSAAAPARDGHLALPHIPGLTPDGPPALPDAGPGGGQPASAASLVLPLGRGAHGKTLWARWLIDELRNTGVPLKVVDADRANATLSRFFPDVVAPDSAGDADVEDCLRLLTEDMMERPRSALVDFGANDLTIKRVSRKLGGFDRYLAGGGIRGVAVHFLGPDRDDLALLRDMEDGIFAPATTVLVLNEALRPEGATTSLFDPVMQDPIFRAAVGRGAQPLFMPRLEVAREVNARRQGFLAAAAGEPGPDGTRLGPWKRSLIEAWRATMLGNHQAVMPWFGAAGRGTGQELGEGPGR